MFYSFDIIKKKYYFDRIKIYFRIIHLKFTQKYKNSDKKKLVFFTTQPSYIKLFEQKDTKNFIFKKYKKLKVKGFNIK